MKNYKQFLNEKAIVDQATGLTEIPDLNPMLFDFQKDMVKWALKRGRAAVFADCGLGKTPIQLEWAKHIPGNVLILAPLAVSQQTVREGKKFGIEVNYCRDQSQVKSGITITNYEMLEHFQPESFTGIVLDESSILKAFDGKTRTLIIEFSKGIQFKLACTATPAPNDYMELGNHAEFLGAMTRTEMLSMFFVHDGGETQQWRLKGHAETEYWTWLCSWAVMIRKPSDLHYDDGKFILPELVYHDVTVKVDEPTTGWLFPIEAQTLQERIQARRDTIDERIADCSAIIARWTKNRNGPTTALTELPIGTKSKRNEKSGIPQILNVSASEPGSINQGLEKNRNTQHNVLTENHTVSICEPTCERDTKKNEQILSHTTESGDPNDQKLRETGISEKNMGSALNNMKPCSLSKTEDVVSTGRYRNGNLQLTTTTLPDASGDYCAQVVTTDLEDSEMTQGIYDEQWIIWCNLNEEANKAAKAIPGSVNIQGSDSRERKERAVIDFIEGKIRVLISKPSIFGYGLNLQCCHNVVFLGLSDSYESYYQAIRRVYRFGQEKPVNVYVITAETEGAVVTNIKRKEADAMEMAKNMVEHMHDLNEANLKGMTRTVSEYKTRKEIGANWTAFLGDCVEVAGEIADESIDYSIYSPPFASLYTYSNSDRDMGNCKDTDEFMRHYQFLILEMYRVTRPGRLTSFHCMNLPTSKTHDGYIGIRDFRGELIRAHIDAGWIYHSEVCIWKDPVTAMQRTKALGLLHKQLKKDSCMSRQGIPDYLVTMRKPGENPSRVSHTDQDYPVHDWQKIASPIWTDINPSDTLQFRSAREHNDDKHICPLQLEVIRRGLRLWSNPGDMVFSPFMGIASEGHVSLQMGRQFIGAELKEAYFNQAVKNLKQAMVEMGELNLTA